MSICMLIAAELYKSTIDPSPLSYIITCTCTVVILLFFFQRDTTGQGQVGGQAAAGTVGGGGGGFQQPQLGPRTIPVMDEQGEYLFKLYMLCMAYIVYYMPSMLNLTEFNSMCVHVQCKSHQRTCTHKYLHLHVHCMCTCTCTCTYACTCTWMSYVCYTCSPFRCTMRMYNV